MRFYNKLITFFVALMLSMSAFSQIKIAVEMKVENKTDGVLEDLKAFVVAVYTKVNALDAFTMQCKSKETDGSSVSLDEPLKYNKMNNDDTTDNKLLEIVSNQFTDATSMIYTPGELTTGEDQTLRPYLNDLGVAKCHWLFAIFHNANTTNYANVASGSTPTPFVNKAKETDLAQTSFFFDPPRRDGKVSNLNTVKVFTTKQNTGGSTLKESNSTYDGAVVIAGAKSGGYESTRACGTFEKLLDSSNFASGTAVAQNTCPIITCAIETELVNKQHLVHRTVSVNAENKIGLDFGSSTNPLTLCAGAGG